MKITGYSTPLDAERAFYAAFERADADAMRAVWAASEDIECIHPLGARLRGSDVHRGWHEMFTEAERLAFHLSDRRTFAHDGLTVHLVLENILFPDGKTEPLQILATNVYRHSADGWRMVMRHASPMPAGLAVAPAARGPVH
jgi:ketosteroid isomerase-like protein